jgi:hypothetical protein
MTSRSLLASELAERLRMRPELSASACWEEEEGGQAGRDRSKGSLVADLITVSRALREKKNSTHLYRFWKFQYRISDFFPLWIRDVCTPGSLLFCTKTYEVC